MLQIIGAKSVALKYVILVFQKSNFGGKRWYKEEEQKGVLEIFLALLFCFQVDYTSSMSSFIVGVPRHQEGQLV